MSVGQNLAFDDISEQITPFMTTDLNATLTALLARWDALATEAARNKLVSDIVGLLT